MNYFMDAITKHYADFSGRLGVKGYWMFVLFYFIIAIVVGVIATLIKLPFLTYILSLALLCPSLAASIRRLRDAGKEWYWIFISFIPIVGLYLIYLLCMPSKNAE